MGGWSLCLKGCLDRLVVDERNKCYWLRDKLYIFIRNKKKGRFKDTLVFLFFFSNYFLIYIFLNFIS